MGCSDLGGRQGLPDLLIPKRLDDKVLGSRSDGFLNLVVLAHRRTHYDLCPWRGL